MREKTGIPGLDKMLGGGIPSGRSILVSGGCGTGKTVLAYQFVDNCLKQGVSCVFVTLEQSKEKVLEDAKRIGIDLKKHLERNKLLLVGGPVGMLRNYKVKTNAKLDDMLGELRDVIEQSKSRIVVIDSVNLFTLLFENDMERRLAFASLAALLEELHCTTIMTCEVQEGEKKLGWFGFEDFVVDGVIVLRRMHCLECLERTASIVKLRGSEHDTEEHPFQITSKGIIMFSDKDTVHKRFGLSHY